MLGNLEPEENVMSKSNWLVDLTIALQQLQDEITRSSISSFSSPNSQNPQNHTNISRSPNMASESPRGGFKPLTA